ncbi:MAG: Ig-like domain-containing protein [Dysgonamonadaceae bacterium]|jgi:uncharacterized protein (DUF2141 family)|nr:Ig-like domain-containing protein [Dysgonamonadaceae bacterium]
MGIIKCYKFLVILLLVSCASIGNPEGGEYDVTAPVMLRSNPAQDAINYTKPRVEFLFDEYISIEKPLEKVIVTPPQRKQPVIRAIGKRIIVELKDTLMENTTYTLDFTNSITDNNERNTIEGFAFAFSTGDVLDTLVVAGCLLDARTLEPLPNIVVGLHNNLSDSAFTELPFCRTSVTNDRGRFQIRNVSPGSYRLFALKDENKNYIYDPPAENIAFHDSLVVPFFEPAVRWDTVYVAGDSTRIDTVREVHYTRFLPDNIVLRAFQQQFDNRYLSKHERPQDNKIVLHFSAGSRSPVNVTMFNGDSTLYEGDEWYVGESDADRREITYWLRDSAHIMRDTLFMEIEYMMTDSLYMLSQQRDTLRFTFRHKTVKPKKEKRSDKTKKGKQENVTKQEFVTIETGVKSPMEVTDTLRITFGEPLQDFDSRSITFSQKVDTVWEQRTLPIVGDSLNPRAYFVDYIWDYGEEYRLRIDSGAVRSIYGKCNDSLVQVFKFRKEEEYAHFYVRLDGSAVGGFGELLDRSDNPVRKVALSDGELAFENILPGTYFLRFTEDTNGNGEWDAGDYSTLRQPEKVYYYPRKLEFRKYFTLNQTWNLHEQPFDRQKPLEVTQNKPQEKRKRTVNNDDRNSRRR